MIYVFEYKGENPFGGQSHFVIVVAASDNETARSYVKEKIGIDVEPVWLMNSEYPTIWINGHADTVQAKILYNGNFHTYSKQTT